MSLGTGYCAGVSPSMVSPESFDIESSDIESSGLAGASSAGLVGSAAFSPAPPHWFADKPTRAIAAAAAIRRNLRIENPLLLYTRRSFWVEL
jgi:hypothetical protein